MANSRTNCAPLFLISVTALSVIVASACGAEPEVDADAPIVIDEAAFNMYFAPMQRSNEAPLSEARDQGLSRQISAIDFSGSLTEDQRNRLRAAGEVDLVASQRIALDARRKMLGRKYPSLREALNDFQRFRYAGSRSPMSDTSLMLKVYNEIISEEQKRLHQQGNSERVGRLLEAQVLQIVLGLSEKVAMTTEQRDMLLVALRAKLPAPEKLTTQDISSVVEYALALIADDALPSIFDEAQLEILVPMIDQRGASARRYLRERDLLKALGGEQTDDAPQGDQPAAAEAQS
jgi:hypothetical protein